MMNQKENQFRIKAEKESYKKNKDLSTLCYQELPTDYTTMFQALLSVERDLRDSQMSISYRIYSYWKMSA